MILNFFLVTQDLGLDTGQGDINRLVEIIGGGVAVQEIPIGLNVHLGAVRPFFDPQDGVNLENVIREFSQFFNTLLDMILQGGGHFHMASGNSDIQDRNLFSNASRD